MGKSISRGGEGKLRISVEAGDDRGAEEVVEAEGAGGGFEGAGKGSVFDDAMDDHGEKELTFAGGGEEAVGGEGLADVAVGEQGPGSGVGFDFFLGAEEEGSDGVKALLGGVIEDDGVAGDAA